MTTDLHPGRRLLEAAYNYQTSKKILAPMHTAAYIIQLLFDLIASLNEAVAEPVDMEAMRRIDAGHFAGSKKPSGTGTKKVSCLVHAPKCHTAGGLPQMLAEGVVTSASPSNGFQCATCHNDPGRVHHTRLARPFPAAPPSTVAIPTRTCMNCHQAVSLASASTPQLATPPRMISPRVCASLNPHYFRQPAPRVGDPKPMACISTKARNTWLLLDHGDGDVNQCRIATAQCTVWKSRPKRAECHEEIEDGAELQDIRYTSPDFTVTAMTRKAWRTRRGTTAEDPYAAIQAYARHLARDCV